MNPLTQERMTQQARQLQQQRAATLSGGFEPIGRKNFDGWSDVLNPWHGELRVAPAVRVYGLSHWRHATAEELMRWVADGCSGWGADRDSVIALGSLYGEGGVPFVRVDPRLRNGKPELTTVTLSTAPTMRLKLQVILQHEPNARALCVVPRG